MQLHHLIFCRKCKVYMELGAFDAQKGYFDGPYLHNTTARTDSDWALRRFLEEHRRHNIGFASDDEMDDVRLAGYSEIQPTDLFCMKFVSDPKTTAYNFENFSKHFQKVLFIVDVYDWAWDIASRELLTFLPEVDGTIISVVDFRKTHFNPDDWDMVLVYPWSHEDLMDKLDPKNTIVCVAGGGQLTELRRKFELNCGRFVVYGANTPGIKKELLRRYPQKRVVLLSHGVDTEKFKPAPIPHDEFTVLWVGAVEREIKRFYLAKSLCEELGIKLKVAGRGDDRIFLTHDEMPEFYNSGDVLFITSNYEAHPLVAYEAMSCGLPVIAGNVGDLWDTIDNGQSGFIFDPCDQARGFRMALKTLRDKEDLRRSMGEKARITILQKWKWEFIANQYRALGKAPVTREDVPKVTVITAVKNRANRVKRCIDSVLDEGYPNLEYIIVDGASTDGTIDVLREYEEKHECITVISEPDKSQGEARNKGLKIATGDYVTFQDSDDKMIDGKLGILSEFLINNDKYFAVFGNTAFSNPGDETIILDNSNSIPSDISFETLNKSNYIGSGAIMLRNSPEVRFNPEIRFGEDYDLWMKLVAKYPMAYLNFNAYQWTQGSPDGIGTNTPDWVQIDADNKANATKRHSGGSHSKNMRIAVFCDSFGLHPYGGPAIYGYNVGEMLYRGRNKFTMFYNPHPASHPHPAYYRRPENLLPRPVHFDPDDFDVFYVMNSNHATRMLNEKGIAPIIGSNHITNSAATHCLPFLNEKQKEHRGHLIAHEKAFINNHRGKFWFAQSQFQIGEYERVGMNLTETQVFLAPNPLDTALFKRRRDYGEHIVWSGKNNWAKGVPYLIKTMEAFPTQKFKCLWGGEGSGFLNLPNNAEMASGGTLFQMPPHHESGKIFLTTSVTENQPCAVLEAMAMELPIVGFNTSGMPEIIKDGETGFLVELGNSKALSEKLGILLKDTSMRREMGKKAREFVVENFSYYATLDTYLDYFTLYLET